MQTVIQAVSKSTSSLRDAIVKDKHLDRHGFEVAVIKRQNRANGWSKLHKPGVNGAVNIEWHSSTKMFICRVVTRGNDAHVIVGDFVGYLLDRHSKKIVSLHIFSM